MRRDHYRHSSLSERCRLILVRTNVLFLRTQIRRCSSLWTSSRKPIVRISRADCLFPFDSRVFFLIFLSSSLPFFFFFFLLFPVRLLPSVIMDIVERQNESYGRIDFHLRSIFHDDGYSILISSVFRRFVK